MRPPKGEGPKASIFSKSCITSSLSSAGVFIGDFTIEQVETKARINPPLDATIQASRSQRKLMKDKLRAVGLNELLGADERIINTSLPSKPRLSNLKQQPFTKNVLEVSIHS